MRKRRQRKIKQFGGLEPLDILLSESLRDRLEL